MNELKVKEKLTEFLIEDIGCGDLTTSSLPNKDQWIQGHFISKEDGIFAGEEIIKLGFSLISKDAEVILFKHDGDRVMKGDIIASVEGTFSTLMAGERVILNLVQRMSGIATMTNEFVHVLDGSGIRICDTRKVMPGLKIFDKYAVTCGGGYNHRFGLYDGVMLKDNHVAAVGSTGAAIREVRGRVGHMIRIEVEIETEEALLQAVEAKADIIMFDNRSPEEIKSWMRHVPDDIVTEVSGGITLENIHQYRETGVNYISIGALTHSVSGLDISFNIASQKEGEGK
ncbi:carboxylating nicotinate-nucleotide diphosphorylase [Bacillus sp. JZ8]